MLVPLLVLAIASDVARPAEQALARAALARRLGMRGAAVPCGCTPAERDALFEGLARLQRGEPERAMLRLQHAQIAQEYGWVAEHVGDLTNRMAQRYSWFEGMAGAVLEKVRKTLRALRHPGFEAEIGRQIRSNIAYNAEHHPEKPWFSTEEEARAELARLGKAYAAAHRKLPVYNDVQRWARAAAIAVGEMNFLDARLYLGFLEEELLEKGEDNWAKVAGRCDPDYEARRRDALEDEIRARRGR